MKTRSGTRLPTRCPRNIRARGAAAVFLLANIAVVAGCAVVGVAGAVVGTAVSVTGSVVSTGVKVTGKVVEKTIDVVTPSSK